MKSRLLAGVIAVLLAIVGAVIVVSYAQGADQRAVSSLDPVGVLVVSKAVPAGSSVETLKASVTLQQLPGTAVAKTALNTLEGSAGKVTSADLVPGEQLVAERLVSPEELQTSGSVPVPAGLQEVSFQLEPQRVVGGRLAPGDTVGIFISMPNGGLEAKPDKETVQLSIHKALVTAVQRAPEGAVAKPAPSASAEPVPDPRDVNLPTGLLMVTVAVNDINADKIVFAAEYASLWLSKEPLEAQDSGPRIMTRQDLYK
ncbi:pilus assembly protein CpaB [Pseudarthrobacter oxydans]|uniref:Pilus assembly protein CpaB n=1 Tax=Pseudarthrobacter oxydans TaxID=1671 RepID=A0AAW8N3R8_PSEOX|nr:flagellar biosynthesis protein FlgA [Pseudarthrobacter oxydans]MDR6791234.1 pilus assembly protein CpaB [Pseudarthrobacter oxydans]MDR7162337.1 pilus assembly protein CpaB [Pseudarthrobacter oxydans]